MLEFVKLCECSGINSKDSSGNEIQKEEENQEGLGKNENSQ